MKPNLPLGALMLTCALGTLLWGALSGPQALFESDQPAASEIQPALSIKSDLTPDITDLEGLRRGGVLRVLYRTQKTLDAPNPIGVAGLSTGAFFEDFARSLELDAEFVPLRSGEDPQLALFEGRGDILAEAGVINRAEAGVLYSSPVAIAQEQVLIRDDTDLDGASELRGKTIALRQQAHEGEGLALDALHYLEARYGEQDIVLLPHTLSQFEILRRLRAGQYDAAVVPRRVQEATGGEELDVAFNLTGEYARAWATRETAPRLAQALDRFIVTQLTSVGAPHIWPPPPLAQRSTLRVLTRPGLATAFIRRGRVAGFEYDLLKSFADSKGLELEIIVPPSADLLIPWLKEGRGDVVANALPIPQGPPQGGITYTTPFRVAEAVLIGADGQGDVLSLSSDIPPISALPQGVGATRLDKAQGSLTTRLVSSHMAPEDLAMAVSSGQIENAAVDRVIASATQRWRGGLAIGQSLGEEALGWALRSEDSPLLEGLNQFISEGARGQFHNIAYRRYFTSHRWVPGWLQADTRAHSLSPYDELVRTHADLNGFDWRMVVAQMYQESRFNPRSRSSRGALGLMQILPRTAKELGVRHLERPEEAIRGGVKYLSRLRARVERGVPFAQRTLFALAAYNVGFGHLEDARALAEGLDRDPNHWYGQAEEAMLKLSEAPYARQARYGYCQGKQPVHYVRQIQGRFMAYVQLHRDNIEGQLLVDGGL